MDVDQTRFLFNKVIEHHSKNPCSENFPRALLNTLDDEKISDPLELQAAEFLRLVRGESGNLEISVSEKIEDRKRLVEIYRKILDVEWVRRNFQEVVKLCRVARWVDEENLEILGIFGRAKWEMGDDSGFEILEFVAAREKKFEKFYLRAREELAEREKLHKRMSKGIFSDENLRRAKLVGENSFCGKLFIFFVVAAYLLFFVGLVLAVTI